MPVQLCEVGPRDGFQFEDQFIPTAMKAEVIEALADAGVRRIQVTSFVHPEKVPQMKDAGELVERLPQREGVTYAGLALNQRGLERLCDTGLEQADLSIATNDRHSRDNAGMSAAEAADEAEAMTRWALERGRSVQVGFQTVFGYQEPGDMPLETITALAERFAPFPLESLSLADTTGMANPQMTRRRVEAVREAAPGVPLVLHLHDTRGLGLANVCAALEAGVERFDTSLAGMGGCPFVHGAAGNIATEDTAYLFEQIGRETGVDYRHVAAASRRVEDVLDKRFPGKLHRLPVTMSDQ
jgi:hydroxymethylglutaryl-CoA lyase